MLSPRKQKASNQLKNRCFWTKPHFW